MEDILVPIAICCVMPVAIVFIFFWAMTNRKRTNAKVLTEALNHADHVDVNRLAEQLDMREGNHRTPEQNLNRRLLYGCVGSLLGIGLLILMLAMSEPGPMYLSDSQVFLAICVVVSMGIGIGNLIVYFVTRKRVLSQADSKNVTVIEEISETEE